MPQGLKIALFVVVFIAVLFGALTLAAMMARENKEKAGGTEAAEKPASPVPVTPPPASPMNIPQLPQSAPQQQYVPPQPVIMQQQMQGQEWNAQNLAGTGWAVGTQYGTFIIYLNPGGRAQASTPMGVVEGTWRVSGKSLTVAAQGQSYTCTIQGDQIIAGDGFPIKRIN